ncbi:MAG: efflux RND transporter periplasmic adaptor subunit [Deltaproteobacteria bacterium]|nr:efflux RND transporter periplasmic adaptor subunit [Deltaproteobacteria bacterium]
MALNLESAAPQSNRAAGPATAAPGVRDPRRRLAWALAVLASLLLVGGLAAVKIMQVRAAIAYGKSFPEPSEAVIEAVAERRSITPTATAIGELQATNIVELRIERAGVLRTVAFRSGDEVAAGAVLVEVDVAEERADLAAARVEAGRAEREARRQASLRAEGIAAQRELDDVEAQAAAARARVAALETAIRRKTIRAPFDGRVGITDLKPGQYVSEGDLVTRLVGADDEMYVDFALPQEAALDFDARVPVSVTIGRETIEAHVVARESAIDAASRSLSFRAVIRRSGREFPAGSLVTVTAPIGAPREEVVIPRTAVVRSPYGDTVYRIEDAGGETRARAVIVAVGDIVGSGDVVVRSGLEPGVRIAADGVFKLRDGALVTAVAGGARAEAATVGR